MFEQHEERYMEEEYSNRSNSSSSPKAIMALFGFILAPSILIGIIIFVIFLRQLRWKPRVTIVPLSIAFGLLYIFSSATLSNLSLENIRYNVSSVISAYLYLSVMIGIVIGYFIIIYKILDLKRHPEYVYIKGWAYGFEYAPTLLDKLRKKRNIKSLKEGQEFDYERAPIGVIDEPVKNGDLEGSLDTKNANKASLTYRYYSEAMAHTLITGKTGSGKALHVDTEIRCKEKGWVTVGEIEVGDTIYDESGNYTEVKAVYQPMTPDHYELTFDNGEVVKACGDHLWNIGDVHEGNTVSTRDLLANYRYDTEYVISHYIDGLPLSHRILKIKRIKDDPKDYLCFTVDSDSHLFLITKSYIPTHNTVTMLSLIQNDILAGNPVCVIDFKKSPDFIYFLSKWAKENGREFFHFVSGKPGTYRNPYKDDQSTYDPLSTGGATAKADMILNLRSWDSASEVFKKRTQDVLGSLFFLLERTPREKVPGIDWDSGGMAQFVSALDLNNFKKMIELMGKDMQAGRLSTGDVRRYKILTDLYKELSSTTKSDLKAQIVELVSIARTLIVSNYGDWLAKGTSDYHIDLMDIATSAETAPIVLFSFNQQEEPEFAQYIGSIVMSDLSRVSALKNAKGDRTKFGVYIDEFQTLDPATVKDNLEKARSSRMYITLSLQSIDQIISSAASQGEAMANAILDTTANFIFHDGSGYDTAEKMSKIIGKTSRYVYKTMSKPNSNFLSRLISVDNAMVSKNIEEDWLIPPAEFQSLESPVSSNGYKATAYVINKSSDDTRFKRSGGALARKVHVVVAEETAQGVPDGFRQEIFIPQDNELEFEEIYEKVDVESNKEYKNDGLNLNEGDWEIEDLGVDVESADDFEGSKKVTEGLNFEEIPDFIEIKDEVKAQESQKEKEKPRSQLDNFKKLNSKKNRVEVNAESKESKMTEVKKDKFTLPKID